MDYVKTGYFSQEDILFPSIERMKKGPVAVIECSQQIPCNPCAEGCPLGAIKVGDNINTCPTIDFDACTGCALCVGFCPGLAIFLVDLSKKDGLGRVSIPYELFPPDQDETVELLDRAGHVVGEGSIEKVKKLKKHDRTVIVTLKMEAELVKQVRGFRRKK